MRLTHEFYTTNKGLKLVPLALFAFGSAAMLFLHRHDAERWTEIANNLGVHTMYHALPWKHGVLANLVGNRVHTKTIMDANSHEGLIRCIHDHVCCDCRRAVVTAAGDYSERLESCGTCRKHLATERLFLCSACKVIIYCSSDCQKKDWCVLFIYFFAKAFCFSPSAYHYFKKEDREVTTFLPAFCFSTSACNYLKKATREVPTSLPAFCFSPSAYHYFKKPTERFEPLCRPFVLAHPSTITLKRKRS
jgi:hypothetical protein